MMFKTPFQGYSVKFSPFEDGRIAVATSQNFGIIGNGRQHVLQVRCLHGGLDAGMFARHSLQARCLFHAGACGGSELSLAGQTGADGCADCNRVAVLLHTCLRWCRLHNRAYRRWWHLTPLMACTTVPGARSVHLPPVQHLAAEVLDLPGPCIQMQLNGAWACSSAATSRDPCNMGCAPLQQHDVASTPAAASMARLACSQHLPGAACAGSLWTASTFIVWSILSFVAVQPAHVVPAGQ